MKIRPATAADKGAIKSFCLSIDPEDYVPQYLDRLMREATILLLYDGKRLVGIDRVARKADNSAWMSAARIHPDYRGRGLINRMNDFALTMPMLAGIGHARMLIHVENASSRRAAEKGGYRVVSEVSIFDWDAPKGRHAFPAARSGFSRATAPQFREALERSALLAAQRGIVYFPPDYGRPTDAVLRAAEREGRLLLSPAAGPMLVFERRESDGLNLSLQPFAPTLEGASAVMTYALERKASFAQVSVADIPSVRFAYERAGFKPTDWGSHALIYERAVKPSSRNGRPAARSRRA